MEQLDDSDGNGHRRNTNINHFAQLFESDNGEVTNNRTKPKTTTIVVSKDEEEEKNKRE